jgi:hypothetical protein
LEGKAEIWFEGYMCELDVSLEWEEFSRAIYSRFGNGDDIVEEFNKLTQEGGMEEYVERFEELKSLMHSLNPLLPESYYISRFISGLKEDIKPMLKILKPDTLMTTFDQAKWQEEPNNILARKNRFSTKPVMGSQWGRSFGNQQSNYMSNNLQTPKVSETMYKQRCGLGQCFKCGDKLMPGHECMVKGLHMIEGREEEEFMDAATRNNSTEMAPDSKIEEYGLSLNALADNYAHNTKQIRGSYQGRDLIILIDSGSTHSFMDANVVGELQLSVENSPVLAVIVVNGSIMLCDSYTAGFTWFMQGCEFVANLRILKLGRCDMVLGVDLLRKFLPILFCEFVANLRILKLGRCDMVLGVDLLRKFLPILFDFIKIKITFKKERRMLELKGIIETASLQPMTVEKVQKNLKTSIMGFIRQFFLIEATTTSVAVLANSEVGELLANYAEVFQEPIARHDHKIPLQVGA